MPNWVSNIVHCYDEDVETLLLLRDFSNIVPYPENPSNPPEEWCLNHWGTKCNAMHFRLTIGHPRKGTYVQFDTAWAHPQAVITALSRRFPRRHFCVSYADEETGRNCGRYLMKDGILRKDGDFPAGSRAAYELAFEHRPHKRIEYVPCADGYRRRPREESDQLESLLIELGMI